MTSDEKKGSSESALLGRLRTVALIAMVAGAVGSLGLMLSAGRRTPRFLLVVFVFWILSPFAALAWAHVRSKRWSPVTRTALYWVMLVLSLGSLAAYGNEEHLRPAGTANAAVFVIVAPTSWILLTIVVSIAALVSRRRLRPPA